MDITRAAEGSVEPPPSALQVTPRVRHLAREALGLMAFSALASTVLAGCLMLLPTLGHQG